MDNFSLVRRISRFSTWFETAFCSSFVGEDAYGNRYYRSKSTPKDVREKRWVIYRGEPEASKVPPEWHGWLHHTMDAPIPDDSPLHQPWQKPHQENLTGTDQAYFPPGHFAAGGVRPKATGDYQAWKPE